MENYAKMNVELIFDEVTEADTFIKIIRKHCNGSKMIIFRRSKNVVKFTINVMGNDDWNKLTNEDIKMLRPDAIQMKDLSKKEQEKIIDACLGLNRVRFYADMDIEL